MINLESIQWDKVQGLLPCIAQDQASGQVLMLGYMNKEALEKTTTDLKLTFWSRTKQRLWCKGESSGNHLAVKDLRLDCDQDALLALVEPQGPTCHKGSQSCFEDDLNSNATFLFKLSQLVHERKINRPEGSYTTSLFNKGLNKISQKVGEEAVETVIAALGETQERVISESSDLLFHLLVLLEEKDLSLNDVIQELRKRN